ncbi:MAG: sensor histidine kinase [Verrucomicrobiota bacterium]
MKGFLSFNHVPSPEPTESQSTYHWSLPEVRIVVIYFILASAWIVGSDLLLTKSVVDQSEVGVIQSLKGLNFVITTAVLLFFVLRRAYGGWRLAEKQRLAVIEQARERFRRLSAHIQTLREEDRTRIAREIHDELGQLLTGIKMEIRLIETRLSDRDDRTLNPCIDRLVEASEMVDSTIDSVRRIAAGLRPSALDHLGLGAALREEAEQFSQRTSIPCEIEIDEYPDILPSEVSTAAFRIFQESLTNVARHAEARHINSSFCVRDNVLELAIHDDGKGIDPSELDDPKSLGLIGMLERAGNVGGKVDFRRGREQGTDVILTIPLPSAVTAPTIAT